MNNDLISRNEVIKAIDELGYVNCHNGKDFEANSRVDKIRQRIVEMPTVYNVGKRWILCSKQLPEEPEEIPTDDEPIEEMMFNGKFQECIVMIWGEDEATTLYYIGNNEWYDGISGETYYKVIAWQPMPKIL